MPETGLLTKDSPQGKILHRSSNDKIEIVVIEIDLTLAEDKNLNSRNHIFKERRPETYL